MGRLLALTTWFSKKRILVFFGIGIIVIGGIAGYLSYHSGYKEGSRTLSRMTAPEVCQYVNQALKTEYVSIPDKTPLFRYELQYYALDATLEESSKPERIWSVNVKVVEQPQVLIDRNWVIADYTNWKLWTTTSYHKYYFVETTGSLEKRY